jgi:hypothetical protein
MIDDMADSAQSSWNHNEAASFVDFANFNNDKTLELPGFYDAEVEAAVQAMCYWCSAV